MRVEFALFEQDNLLRRGSLLICAKKGISCCGEQHPLSVTRATGESLVAQAFSGLIIEHEFELPAAGLSLRYLEMTPSADGTQSHIQTERFVAALRMGVHRSEDWESVALGYRFAFRCDPL